MRLPIKIHFEHINQDISILLQKGHLFWLLGSSPRGEHLQPATYINLFSTSPARLRIYRPFPCNERDLIPIVEVRKRLAELDFEVGVGEGVVVTIFGSGVVWENLKRILWGLKFGVSL